MRIWITKWALTKGVVIRNDLIRSPVDSRLVVSANRMECFIKPDWHDSEGDAVRQVVGLAEAKIKSLKAQLRKMRRILEECDTLSAHSPT